MTNKNYLISAILMLIAAVCFGISAFLQFYSDKALIGALSSLAAITDLTACIMHYVRYKNSKDRSQII